MTRDIEEAATKPIPPSADVEAMPEVARSDRHRRSDRSPSASNGHLREEALRFTRWFVSSKYKLMGEFIGELDDAPAERRADEIRDRYCRALAHGQRVLYARTAVTILLAFGVIAAAVTTVMRIVAVPSMFQGDLAATQLLLDRIAAYSASGAAVLVGARLLLDRYLERVDITATFLAIQLATCER